MTMLGTPILVKTFVPTATVEKNRFVALDGLTHCAAGDKAYGVSWSKTLASEQGDAITEGEAYVTAGTGGTTAGDPVESDADGKAVAVGAGIINGYALETVIAGAVAKIQLK